MKRATKHKLRASLVLVLGVLLLFSVAILLRPTTSEAPRAPEQSNENKNQPPDSDTPSLINLQPTVDTWVAGQSGTYGIVVYDPANEQVIASHRADERYFTASIYKLYLAYVTLLEFQKGTVDPDAILIAGQTNKECVFKMVHESDSPCGEAMLDVIGRQELTDRLNEFGFTGTGFPAFLTTAADANRILMRLHASEDLTEENEAFLLEAMRTQIFRNALPAGMPEATVADKVGFNTPDQWVDVGIVTLPNGRDYLVTIFGEDGVGTAELADFGRTIYPVLMQD